MAPDHGRFAAEQKIEISRYQFTRLTQRRPIGQMLRTAGRVDDVDEVGVDAEVAIRGGEHLALIHGTLGRVTAETIGSAMTIFRPSLRLQGSR